MNLCSGIGIAQEVQTQIFEAFAQADMSTSQHTEAVMAAVSCELSERHDGSMHRLTLYLIACVRVCVSAIQPSASAGPDWV